MRWFWARMLGVGVGQIGLGVALYGCLIYRVTVPEIALVLPTFLAFCIYPLLVWHEALAKCSLVIKLLLTPLLALLALAISTMCLATIAFNLWGK